MWLSNRRREAEWMDAPDVDPRQLRRSLAFIRQVNRFCGYTRSTIAYLSKLSRSWREGETIRIVDLGTGSADVPAAIVRWAQRRGFDVRVVGLDLHARTMESAAATHRALAPELRSRLSLVRGDVLQMPLADGSFDYAITSLLLHHLSDEQAEAVLASMGRLARRGIIATDLLRHRRAYAWVWLATLPLAPIMRHDALVSVAQAFSRAEVLAMRDRAGVSFATFHTDFGHRFALVGEKQNRPDGQIV